MIETMGPMNSARLKFVNDTWRRITQASNDNRESAFLFLYLLTLGIYTTEGTKNLPKIINTIITSVPKVIWEQGRVASNVSHGAGCGQHA